MCLVISILYIILYGRVGGVSRGGCAYPDIQITGRLYHFFWKPPNFSFRQFFWNSCYNLYLHQYQNPTKSQKWRGLLKTFGIFKHCVIFLKSVELIFAEVKKNKCSAILKSRQIKFHNSLDLFLRYWMKMALSTNMNLFCICHIVKNLRFYFIFLRNYLGHFFYWCFSF